jgi:hypothetical protein
MQHARTPDDRLFPDRSYAPGHEPAPREETENAADHGLMGMAELARFVASLLLVGGVLGLFSAIVTLR